MYKVWRRHRDEFVALLGREPNQAANILLDAMADVAVELWALRTRRQYGEPVNVEHIRGCASELRRMQMSLGLVERTAKPADRYPLDLADMLEAS